MRRLAQEEKNFFFLNFVFFPASGSCQNIDFSKSVESIRCVFYLGKQ